VLFWVLYCFSDLKFFSVFMERYVRLEVSAREQECVLISAQK
jgi:hypothetical protein